MVKAAASAFLALSAAVGLIACGGSNSSGEPRIINGEFLTTADRSKISADIAELNSIAAANGLEPVAAERFTIEIVERSPNCNEISFEVRSSCFYDPIANPHCYDGSIYDKDPTAGQVSICAAGRFLPETNRIVVTLAGIRSTPIVRFEGEHFLLRLRNSVLYAQTLTHREGGHPILTVPPCDCVQFPCDCSLASTTISPPINPR